MPPRKLSKRQSGTGSTESAGGPSEAVPLSPPRQPFMPPRGHLSEAYSYTSNDTLPEVGSDSDHDHLAAQQLQQQQVQPGIRQRNPRRRSQLGGEAIVAAPPADEFDPFAMAEAAYDPAAPGGGNGTARSRAQSTRGQAAAPAPPPSAFQFPFQARPGNADPGLPIPGLSRRSSVESVRQAEQQYSPTGAGSSEYHSLAQGSPMTADYGAHGGYPAQGGYAAPGGYVAPGEYAAPGGYATPGEYDGYDDLGRPQAPFMAGGARGSPGNSRRSSATSAMYRDSAAGALHSTPELGRMPSASNMRAPFLSPASRPSSSVWAPPAFVYGSPSAAGSRTALGTAGLKQRPVMPSTRLANKLTADEKPWIKAKDTAGRVSWWITIMLMVAGIAIGALVIYLDYKDVLLFQGNLCSPLTLKFDGELDPNSWTAITELGTGFSSNEFEAVRNDPSNLAVIGGQLHLIPTLVSDTLDDPSQIINGGNMSLPGCTSSNETQCSVNSDGNNVLPPVYSARIISQGQVQMKFGRIEVKAKLPVGDWLWPSIRMLPINNTYGGDNTSLVNGEIDIMEARGNAASYPNGGNNVARSTLNYGPLPSLTRSVFGYQQFRHSSLADGFHTYVLEWDHEMMRFYIDNRLQSMLTVDNRKTDFYASGHFPLTAQSNSSAQQQVVENPWTPDKASVSKMAPYDQLFAIQISLGVGGTSGWFPDQVGGKPWFDNSNSALKDFAASQSTADWPKQYKAASSHFIIDSVKIYQREGDGVQCPS